MLLLLVSATIFGGCGTNQVSGASPRESGPGQATGAPYLKLPTPRKTGGLPLMEALASRRTNRRIADKQLPLQTLSNLLWAAAGVNRPDSGKRTAPTAVNSQEIDIYVALSKGLYLYEPSPHRLKHIMDEDLREVTGRQRLVRAAPVDLIYVADLGRMSDIDEDEQDFYAATDTGFISQNVYLFCASEGLATVVIGYLHRDKLAGRINLGRDQKVILTQAVGYPR